MAEETKNLYVRWKVFIWTLSVITLLIGGLFTMSGKALEASNANKNTLDVMVERENNHYSELKGVVDNIDGKVDELLKKN